MADIIVDGRRYKPLKMWEYNAFRIAYERVGPQDWHGATPVLVNGEFCWDVTDLFPSSAGEAKKEENKA